MGSPRRRSASGERPAAHATHRGRPGGRLLPTDNRLRAVREGAPPAAEFVNEYGGAGRFRFCGHFGTYLFCLAAMPDASVMRAHSYR